MLDPPLQAERKKYQGQTLRNRPKIAECNVYMILIMRIISYNDNMGHVYLIKNLAKLLKTKYPGKCFYYITDHGACLYRSWLLFHLRPNSSCSK